MGVSTGLIIGEANLFIENSYLKNVKISHGGGIDSIVFQNSIYDIEFNLDEFDPAIKSPSERVFLQNNIFTIPNNSSLIAPEDLALDSNNLYSTDPLFLDPANGNYHLAPCSPGRDAGDSTLINTAMLLFDLDGNPRIQGDQIDIGPYESHPFSIQDFAITNPLCAGETGSLSLTLEHGCPPFSVYFLNDTLSTDSTHLVFTDVPEGSFEVIIEDSRLETDTLNFDIVAPPAITLTSSSEPVDCNDQTLGTAQINASGGTGDLFYQWDTQDTITQLFNLPAATYTVTVF